MAIDLTNAQQRLQLVARMQADLDQACRTMFADEPRKHLGASVLGDDCQAKIWLAWRWVHAEEFDGRMLRLFNRGHLEEPRFVRWLSAMGCTVWELDPATQKQFRISGVMGHFGGSLDGIVRFPAHYNVDQDLLSEFKTHSDKSFTKLKQKGVKLSKPVHYRQMCSYGRAYGLRFGLYVAVNKNTDEIWFEIVELDYLQADDLFRKAENIIRAQSIPRRISLSSAHSDCKYCVMIEHCHAGAMPAKNCRSCKLAVPIENGQWGCTMRNLVIPDEVIKVGCPAWVRII